MNSSIQSRLRNGMILGLMVAFISLWLLVNHSIRYLSEVYVSDRLEQEVDSILTEMSLDDQDNLLIDEKELDNIFHHAFSGHYYQIILEDGDRVIQTVRSRSLKDESLKISTLDPGVTDHFFVEGPKKQSLMVLVKSLTIREYTLTIAVGEDSTPFLRNFQKFIWDFSIIAALVFLAIVMVQMRLLTLSFKPMRRLIKEFRLLENGEITRLRLEVPSEVEPLVGYINTILESTDRQLERSRNALGNLSHALKIPVTALSQLAERMEMEDHPDIQQEIAGHVATLHALVERQLKRARLTDPVRAGGRFFPAQEVPALVRTLKSIYYHKHLVIEVDMPLEASCRGDREDLVELIGNLADNACKWANSEVRLTAGRSPEQGFWLLVEDDGPGCEESQLGRLGEKGGRLDESRGGHGLGLAIVKDVVAQYGGRIIFGRSTALGGLLVRVEMAS